MNIARYLFIPMILHLMMIFTMKAESVESVEQMTNIVLKTLPTIHGWCSKQKALAMMDLVLTNKPQVCVEIGVYGGASILPTAIALKYNGEGIVYAIDPWDNNECIRHYDDSNDPNRLWWSNVNLELIYRSYEEMLYQLNLETYVITLRETSELASSKIEDIDILHIDGNHTEESSLFDATTYLPKVRTGGYIWFDDVKWGSTKKAMEYLSERCDIVKVVDQGNCVLFRKKIE